jgi:hypothetical protein
MHFGKFDLCYLIPRFSFLNQYVNYMETRFTLLISLQLLERKLSYGKFSLGKKLNMAQDIFSMLKGKMEPIAGSHIQIEFVQELEGLPVPIGILNCSLEELKENVAVISKAIFRVAHLEDEAPNSFQL